MTLRKPRGQEFPAATILRNPTSGDAERIRRVLQVAFEDEYRRMGLRETRMPTVSEPLLRYMIDRYPDASFAAEGKGGIVGFCLACRWGTTGWLGPVAVLPPAQGRGLGKRLVGASLEVLRDGGARTLGIETMPRSYRNLQFYSGLGMAFECMTLDMSRAFGEEEVWPAVEEVPGLQLSAVGGSGGADRLPAMQAITEVGERIAPGLDYRAEVEATERHRLGETVLATLDGEAVGFAVVHTAPYAREELPGTARINTLLAAPAGGGKDSELKRLLDGMLAGIFSRVRLSGIDTLIVRVPVVQNVARRLLLERGFKITHSDVRMTLEGFRVEGGAGSIHLSKWE